MSAKKKSTESITNTWIGQEFGWDRLEDVNWELLKNNLDSAINVFGNPEKFPKADFAAMETRIQEIEMFMELHGKLS